jgi:exopolysaccharide production protein ExoQ
MSISVDRFETWGAGGKRSLLVWIILFFLSVLLGIGIVFYSLVVLGTVLGLLGCCFWVRTIAPPPLSTFLVIVLVFAPIGSIFSFQDRIVDVSSMSEAIESGSLISRVVIPLLFILGLILCLQRPYEVSRVNLLLWLTLYLGIIALSYFWSWAPALTLRRSIIPICIIVFSLGVGAVYYGTNPKGYIPLIRTIVWSSSTASLLILGLGILHGDFKIFEVAWRLGGFGIENLIAWVSGAGFLVGWATKNRGDIWPKYSEKLFHLIVLATVLILTKSRTTLLAVVAGILVGELFAQHTLRQRITRATVLMSAGVVLYLTPFFSALLSRGEEEETIQSLSGRVPLWEAIWDIISSNLWFGVGWGGLWSETTISKLSSHWTPGASHNGYLELLGDVGLVGIALAIVITVLSFWNCLRILKYQEFREIGVALIMLIVASLVVSFGMSWYLQRFQEYPSIIVWVYSIFVAHRVSLLESTLAHSRHVEFN